MVKKFNGLKNFNMRKFVITETGKEVKIGDTLSRKEKKKTSFGTMYIHETVLVTEENIQSLIERGIVKEVIPETTPNSEEHTLSYYVKKLAEKRKASFEDTVKLLDSLNKVNAKAVLDLLLQEIAVEFCIRNPIAFNQAEDYYSLKISDGTVGKVHKLGRYIPLFKSVEDAEIARTILKEQLEYMYGR